MTRDFQKDCQRAATDCACLRVRQAARVITQLYDVALSPVGLRATQFSVLVGAGISDRGTSLGALARRLVIDRSTLTRNLAVLVDDGLVELERAAGDARSRIVRLSPKGRRVLERAMPLWRKAQERLAAALGSSSWDGLHARLGDVVALAADED